MADFRDEFPVTQNWHYLDHAAVAPLSRRARKRIEDWAKDLTENGDVNEGGWWREVEGVRTLAASFLNASPGEIAFLKNTSEGLALVAEGFPWKPGDNVVIAEGEYPANVYPWIHLHDRGVEVKIVPSHEARIRLEDIERTIDARTRLVSLSFVQFATGFRSDLAAVGSLCKERGIDFCVDAIQGLGVFPIDVEAMQIDYLSADGHKWLVAPEGCSIFYIKHEKIEKIRATSVGWKSVVRFLDYSTIDFRLKTDASRYEGGSYNIPGIVGLGASLELLQEVGIDTINTEVSRITNHLVEELDKVGAQIISPRGEGEWSGIVSFSIPGVDLEALHQECRRRNIVLSLRGGRLRASPHFYNNHTDIAALIDTIVQFR